MPDYAERGPGAALADRVACVWSHVAGHDVAVHPDACVDLVHVEGMGLVVAGPDTEPLTERRIEPGAVITGVRLRPGWAAAVLGLPASELRDRRTPLAELWGAELADRCDEAATPAERQALLLDAIARRAGEPADPLAVAAVDLLAADPGRRVALVARELALSERQLRRRVTDAVGYGPKTLARILRFQRLLALAESGADSLAGLAARAGYADQSHMTGEVGRLAGAPPSAVVGVVGARGDRSLSVSS